MTVNLPKDWSEVTLEQYIQLHDLNEMEGEEEERAVAILSVMSGLSIEDLREVRISDIGRMISKLDFLKTPATGKIKRFWPLTWNGYRITKTAKDLTAGQYIDLNYFLTNVKAPKNFPDVMAILMQPTRFGFVRKKKPLEHGEIREAAKQMPMTVVKPLADFFLQAYSKLEETTVDYSLQKMKEELKKAQEQIHLMQDTAGSELSTTYLTGTEPSGTTS